MACRAAGGADRADVLKLVDRLDTWQALAARVVRPDDHVLRLWEGDDEAEPGHRIAVHPVPKKNFYFFSR